MMHRLHHTAVLFLKSGYCEKIGFVVYYALS